ncbi:MAG: LamG domain-containing protein, partial [Candidatus Methanoperedens sp.]|nr:LamG domain-containing protein [Candidatus Methanoperedens sp.]
MQEKRELSINPNILSLPGLSRLLLILSLSFIFIQFLFIPARAERVEYYEGYNIIYHDDGTREIIDGAMNYFRWDGVWRPNSELNISNGNWPYLYTENASNADFKVDDTNLSIPKANTTFITKLNSISYNLIYSKSDLQRKETSIDLTSAFLDFPYNLKSKKSRSKYNDSSNIIYGRFHFKAGMEHIVIHDDTPRDYIEDGKVFQDVTYLNKSDYDFRIINGAIRLVFKKGAINKLQGNVVIETRTWDIVDGNNSMWGGNVTFNTTTGVRATGNVELRQKVDDYSLYTRFDEGNGMIIHNENSAIPLLGDLKGTVNTNTYIPGIYGKAIFFNGIDNKVLFSSNSSFELPGDFTISYYIKLKPKVNNSDTDILRKGSTATADPMEWYKIEFTNNITHGSITKNGNVVYESYDSTDRRDGIWHFYTYTRQSTTCSLIVDGSIVNSTTCPQNAPNFALLSIGAKDTIISDTGTDYTNGTIDEVRMYNRKLSSLELASIRNNTHFSTGTVTRNLTSVISTGEELKELGCNGTWDKSITKVDITASTNNITWDTIQLNADKNILYSVNPGKKYIYSRCSLSTTNISQTPIIESIRSKIGPILPPISSSPTYTIGSSGNAWAGNSMMDNVTENNPSGNVVIGDLYIKGSAMPQRLTVYATSGYTPMWTQTSDYIQQTNRVNLAETKLYKSDLNLKDVVILADVQQSGSSTDYPRAGVAARINSANWSYIAAIRNSPASTVKTQIAYVKDDPATAQNK